MTRQGRSVRYVGSTFIAAEETAFAVFQAAEPDWVAEVNQRAGQPFDRIVPVVDLRESERPSSVTRGPRPVDEAHPEGRTRPSSSSRRST
jgi:hypothetical protein